MIVHKLDVAPSLPVPQTNNGVATKDVVAVPAWRSGLLKLAANDILGRRIVAINGQPAAPGSTVEVADGRLSLMQKNTVNSPPCPLAAAPARGRVAAPGGHRAERLPDTPLWEHLGVSPFRVLAGFAAGAALGIALIIIWFGIWERGNIALLFLAALWIMAIAAQAGVESVRLSKVQAAWRLGTSKEQGCRA